MTRLSGPVTIIDVAREAGVSKSTAARVMSGNGSASPKAQRKVVAAAERLGYRPNGIAKAMASGTSHTIGAVIPDVANPFFSAVTRGLADAGRAAAFEVILGNTDNDPEVEARSLDVLTEKRVDGLIVAPVVGEDPEEINRVISGGIPVVLVDRKPSGIDERAPLVSVDHAGATRLATEHLIRLGHTRMAIVTEAAEGPEALLGLGEVPAGITSLRPSSQRLLGHLLALASHDLPIDPRLILRSGYDADSARETVGRALDTRMPVSAIVCTDSVLTIGAYASLVDRDISIPRDVSFVGFDDQDWMTLVRPSITVVDQPKRLLGETAARLLLSLIEAPEVHVDDVHLPAEIIERGSTGRPSSRPGIGQLLQH